MKFLEVPVFNEDGSIKVTHLVSPQEAQALLQFSLNFLSMTGLTAVQLAGDTPKDWTQQELPLSD
jgi:hypothetical protein